MNTHRTCLTTVALLWAAAAHAAPRPTVVELFTSEGCSSCPPAETYLGELAQRPDVLALAFHVQYWDDLGWQDKFGLPGAAPRQNAYVQALHRPSAYTPQVILDGREDLVGSDRGAIGSAVAARSHAAPASVPVQIGLNATQATVTVGALPGPRADDVLLVAYRRRAVTAVGRGENSGKTLAEYNIVRSVQTLGHWDGTSAVFNASLSQLPKDATDIAILVQGHGQGPILGAATTALARSP